MGLRIPNLLPRRRAHRVLVGVLLLLVAAWFVVPQLFVPKIRAKLQGMIAGHLDARLEIGRMMYAPPFGVRARDVRLIGGSGAGGEHAGLELLKVRKLDLKLARLPFRKGPLVIQNITVTDPEAHLVRTRPSPALGLPEDADPDAARAKLSDMFELRHLGIHNGRFVYEDRSRPGLPPVVWKDVDVGMATTPKSKAVYGYTLEAIHGDLARLTASGSFDLDRLLIDLGALHLEAQRTAAQDESPLPAQVQQALRDYRVAGHVLLDAAGHFELRDPSAAKFKAALELRDASAYLPRSDRSLDRIALKLNMENAGPRAVRIHLDQFEAISGDSVARIDKGEATLDTRANTWNVSDVAGNLNLGPQKDTSATAPHGTVDFTLAAQGILRPATGQTVLAPQDFAFLAYPRALSFQPRGFPAPLLNLGGGGSVRKDLGTSVVLFENLTFSYGGDPATLASARLPLPPDLSDLRRAWRLEEISGTLDFRRPGPRYPGKFGNVVDSLRPVGPFSVGRDSWYAVAQVGEGPRAPRRKADWFFSVATDSGSFTLTKDRIPLENIKGDATVSNMLIDVRRLEADVLGGRLTAAVQVTPGTQTKYQGTAYLRHVDLDAVSKVYIVPETTRSKLSGEGNLDIAFTGTRPPADSGSRNSGSRDSDSRDSWAAHDSGPPHDSVSPLDTLRATGEFEILRGQLWTFPLLGEVARRAGHGVELTAGEAAGVFDVAGGQILLRSAAVSSPALGVQASGTIGPDRRLDLTLVAAPLGDWRDKLRQTRVPLLSDAAGDLAGAVQSLVNTTTSHLLYQFRVTGTTQNPDVAPVPVPALTDPAAALFGGMLRERKEGALLESVKAGQHPTR